MRLTVRIRAFVASGLASLRRLVAQARTVIITYLVSLIIKVRAAILRGAGAWLSLRPRILAALEVLWNVALSILGLAIAVFLFRSQHQATLAQVGDAKVILIASGTLIGTILALVFSLSIIPIQRTVESFTPSITRLYRRDPVTQLVFVFLSVFCIFSFAMAAGLVSESSTPRLMAVQIVIIAVSLDLVRLYHRRVIQLLEPREAITRLARAIKRFVDKTQQTVSWMARVQRSMLRRDERDKYPAAQLESAVYLSLARHGDALGRWTGELAEAAVKAVTGGHTNTAEISVAAIADVARYYLNCRRQNLILRVETINVLSSDVHDVLTPIYEHLSEINRVAIARGDQTAAIHAVRALGSIVMDVTNLKAPAFPENRAPLTWLPLGYLSECVKAAQVAGLNNVVLEGSRVLLSIAPGAPKNVEIGDVHLPVVKGLYEIATGLLVSGHDALANEVVKAIMSLAHHLLESDHFELRAFLTDATEKLEDLGPLAVARERVVGTRTLGLPLSPPYDLSERTSLGYFVGKATKLSSQSEGKSWVNPYSKFIELNEVIWRHLRDLAEKADLGSSFLFWHLAQTVKHISRIYLELAGNPATDNRTHINQLVNQVPWYLSCLWVAFSKATSISEHNAREACDSLAWIGIAFAKAHYVEVSGACASDIASVANSFCRLARSPSPYDVADLLMAIWQIRRAVMTMGDGTLVSKLESRMAKPESLADGDWPGVQEALEVRKRQFEDELRDLDEDRLLGLGDAMSLLKRILFERRTMGRSSG